MRKPGLALSVLGMVALALPVFAEVPTAAGVGQAVVTVLPGKNYEGKVNIEPRDLQVKVDGGLSSVTGWTPLRGVNGDLEVVVLIDGGARSGFGNQLPYIADFLKGLPAGAKAGLAYMEYGRAAMQGPLSTDHEAVAHELRLPSGIPGSSASPYFCLSSLAKHWPSTDKMARREVVIITNGVDNYGETGDMADPYVENAIHDSVKAGLVVYSIYWNDFDGFRGQGFQALSGQSLIRQVTRATGGESYWTGTSNPVTLEPYFKDIMHRLENQYRLSFSSGLKGKPEVKRLALRVGGPPAKVIAPDRVYVTPKGED